MQDPQLNISLQKDKLNTKKIIQQKPMLQGRLSHSFEGIQGTSNKTTPLKNAQLDISQKFGFSHLQTKRASLGEIIFMKNDNQFQEQQNLKEIPKDQLSNNMISNNTFRPKIPSKKFDPRFQLLRLFRQRNQHSSLGLFTNVSTKQSLRCSTIDSVIVSDENNLNVTAFTNSLPLTSKFILQIKRPSSVQDSRKNSQQNLLLHRVPMSSAISLLSATQKASFTTCFLEQQQQIFNSVIEQPKIDSQENTKDILKEQSVESTQRDYQSILLMNSTPQSQQIRPQTVPSAVISLTQYSSLETQPDYSFFDLPNYENNKNPQKIKKTKTAISFCKSKQHMVHYPIKTLKTLDSPRVSLDHTFTEEHIQEIRQKEHNNVLITSLEQEQDQETYEEIASSIQSEEHLISCRYEDYLSSRYNTLSDQDPTVSRRYDKSNKKNMSNSKENNYFNYQRCSMEQKHNFKDEQLKKCMSNSVKSQSIDDENYQQLILGNNNNNQIYLNAHKTVPDWLSYQQTRINSCKQAINNKLYKEIHPGVIFQNRQIKCKTSESNSMHCADTKFEITPKQLTCNDLEILELNKTSSQQSYLPRRPRLTRKSESDIEKLRMNNIQQPIVNKSLNARRKTESNIEGDYIAQEYSQQPRIHSRKICRALKQYTK